MSGTPKAGPPLWIGFPLLCDKRSHPHGLNEAPFANCDGAFDVVRCGNEIHGAAPGLSRRDIPICGLLENDDSGGIRDRAARVLEYCRGPNAYAWYKPILVGLVLPHADVVGPLIIVGEALAGIGLLLGLGTRVAAIIAIFLNCNYLCAKGLPLWAPASNDVPDIILALIVIVTSGGLYYGLDGVLTRKRSHRG